MKLFNRLLIIESKNDYKNGVVWEKEDSIRLDKIGVIYHNGNNSFPQFYKYSAPYDGHLCAEYFKTDEQEAYKIIEDYIEKRRSEINSLLDLLPDNDLKHKVLDISKKFAKECHSEYFCKEQPYSKKCKTCAAYYNEEEIEV